MPENGRGPDHDTLLQIKAMQDSFIREMGQAIGQLNKDIYQLTTALKDMRLEHKDDICKLDKRLLPVESSCKVVEERMNQSKEDRLKLRHDLKSMADDLREDIREGDQETKDEVRRSIVQWTSLTGLIVGVACTIIGIVIGLEIG